jgi:two-component system chemotaxis response regulator CheB
MPGAVATAGLAHRVLPLLEVAPAIERVLAEANTGERSTRWA